MYLTFMRYYLQLFTAVLTVDEIHHKSGFILGFLALWRRQLGSPGCTYTVTNNFLTNQTFQDTVISVNCLLLFLKMLQEKLGEANARRFIHMYRFVPSYLSSRFLEYLFAFARTEHRNATSFSVYAGFVHVNHYVWFQELMYILGEQAPCSRRGVPQGPARIDGRKGDVEEELGGFDDARRIALIDAGCAECLKLAHAVRAAHLQCGDLPIPTLDELKGEVLFAENLRKVCTRADLKLPRRNTTAAAGTAGGGGAAAGGVADPAVAEAQAKVSVCRTKIAAVEAELKRRREGRPRDAP